MLRFGMLGFLCLWSFPVLIAAPLVRVETSAVVASGVTARGDVVLFSVAREPQAWGGADVIQQRLVARDDDGDGVVRFTLAKPVPHLSVWAAVDLATGEYAFATKEPFPLRVVAWPPESVKNDKDGNPRKLELFHRAVVDVLWVRPGSGAWVKTLRDGDGNDDENRNDGRIGALLEGMRTVSGGAPPNKLQKDDVLLVIDQRRMEAFGARLAK